MISHRHISGSLVEIAKGESVEFDKSLFEPDVIRTIRYADPAAWIIATSMARALGPLRNTSTFPSEHTGVIVTSDHGPEEATAAVAQAAREGYPSPLRYAAANPGSFVGVSCIALGLRGPTLNLLASPEKGVPMGLFMADRWLRRGAATVVALAACSRVEAAKYRARVVLLARDDRGDDRGVDPRLIAWMGSPV